MGAECTRRIDLITKTREQDFAFTLEGYLFPRKKSVYPMSHQSLNQSNAHALTWLPSMPTNHDQKPTHISACFNSDSSNTAIVLKDAILRDDFGLGNDSNGERWTRRREIPTNDSIQSSHYYCGRDVLIELFVNLDSRCSQHRFPGWCH